MSQTRKQIEVSIVIPVMNEAENIPLMISEIQTALKSSSKGFEIIFVDDGSSDNSWEIIQEQNKEKKWVRGIKLSRNFGHQSALTAGLASANGECIISMDGDLQHPPSILPEMIKAWRNGFQIIKTKRLDRGIESTFKTGSSSLFYKFFSRLTDVEMDPGSSDFRLIDAKVRDDLISWGSNTLFWRGVINWAGYNSCEIQFEVAKRIHGVTKYNLKKMKQFASDALTSFSLKPLIFSIQVGLLTSFFAFVELVYVVYIALSGESVPGWASTLGIISFLFGVLFVLLGIIGSYLARMHVILLNKPAYLISEQAD